MSQLGTQLPPGLEPMTAFTDAILAAWTAFWAAFLFARANGRRPVILWAWGFAAAAVSSLAGVAYHGWRIFFEPVVSTTALAWKTVPVTIGITALCLGWGAALVWLRGTARRVVMAILVAEFIACLIAAALSNDFLVAAVDYLIVLVAILIGCVRTWHVRASRLLAVGIAVCFIAATVQMIKPLHIGSFDHNDIYHVIQMTAMVLLYRGAVLLEPLPSEASVRVSSALAPA